MVTTWGRSTSSGSQKAHLATSVHDSKRLCPTQKWGSLPGAIDTEHPTSSALLAVSRWICGRCSQFRSWPLLVRAQIRPAWFSTERPACCDRLSRPALELRILFCPLPYELFGQLVHRHACSSCLQIQKMTDQQRGCKEQIAV